MPLKIAILGIYHESNTFVETPTVLADFQKGHYLKGEAIRNEYQHAHHEIGGMLEILDREGLEVIPVMYAEATPGGTISAQTYQVLLQDLMLELEKVFPVDALLVVPHGAGVSEDYPDMDGHWLSRVRERVGVAVPVVGTLDLHANVSDLMVESTNALIAYKQNPHVDQRERGKEAAILLMKLLRDKINPVQVLKQVPVVISIEQQLTADEPCNSLYAYADKLSQQEGILSISIQLGFPYADVFEMGTSLIVISNNNQEQALNTANTLEEYIINNRDSFIGEKNDIPTALSMVTTSKKPVLLLDMGDNIGGGGPGNNGVKKLPLKIKLVQISDGNFREENPRHGGQVNFKMGKTAIVSTEQGSIIMLTSLRTVPFSLNQLTSCDIIPADFDAIVAKGVIAPVAAYSEVCPVIIQVNTPGVTQADMTLFDFKNRRKPLYPFENFQ